MLQILLPLALAAQLWALAACCLPNGSAIRAGAWSPGGVLVLCTGDGEKRIDTEGGGVRPHGGICAGLCGVTALPLPAAIAWLGPYVVRLRGRAAADIASAAQPVAVAYRATGPPTAF